MWFASLVAKPRPYQVLITGVKFKSRSTTWGKSAHISNLKLLQGIPRRDLMAKDALK
ncbi:unnamed protein product [Dovyalis caffra]|uniref:Uncharacterized protein n=1 Tax=Dovyalis caffra TaxID=77055 RepID=A0AAV1R9Z6_9ROSI|nr:unnamed protein product [Dovyalis caffra]